MRLLLWKGEEDCLGREDFLVGRELSLGSCSGFGLGHSLFFLLFDQVCYDSLLNLCISYSELKSPPYVICSLLSNIAGDDFFGR